MKRGRLKKVKGCCASTGKGLLEGFQWLVEKMDERSKEVEEMEEELRKFKKQGPRFRGLTKTHQVLLLNFNKAGKTTILKTLFINSNTISLPGKMNLKETSFSGKNGTINLSNILFLAQGVDRTYRA